MAGGKGGARGRGGRRKVSRGGGSNNPPEEVQREEETVEVEVPQRPKLVLSTAPGGNWFTHPEVKKQISASIKAQYKEHCPSWTQTPPHIRRAIWGHFVDNFTFSKEEAPEVYAKWEAKTAERLGDIIYRVREDAVPWWMGPALHQELMEYRQSEEFKKRANVAKSNRTLHKKEDGKPLGTHKMGRKSAIEMVDSLSQGLKRAPTVPEVFNALHGPGGNFVDDRARDIHNELERRMVERDAQGDAFDPTAEYYDIVGGWSKGRMFGLGNAATMYYSDHYTSSGSSTRAAKSSYSPGVLTKMQETQRKYEESQRKYEEELAEHKRMLKEHSELLELMRARMGFDPTCSNPFNCPPFPGPGGDDDGDGAAGGAFMV